MEKTSTPDYFQREGEIAIYVVPSDKIMSHKGFLWIAFIFSKLKTLVNLNIILALLEFLVLYVESQVYITSSPLFFLGK